jgi:hypothetical protein
MKNITTADFDLLATAATFIRKDFEKETSMWAGSRFEWVLKLPSGSKGKLGKLLVKQWCAIKDLTIDRSPDSEADMLINGHRVEIKFSTLWESGIYKFQQIRDQNYEYSVMLGISPFTAHCWVVKKSVLKQYVIGHTGQHTGSKSKETAWLAVNPNDPPTWLSKYGGSLDEAYNILKALSRQK